MRSDDEILNDMIRNPEDGVDLVEVGANFDASPGPRPVYASTGPSAGWWFRLLLLVGWTLACAVLWLGWGSSAAVAAAANGIAGGLSVLLVTGVMVGIWVVGVVTMAAISVLLR